MSATGRSSTSSKGKGQRAEAEERQRQSKLTAISVFLPTLACGLRPTGSHYNELMATVTEAAVLDALRAVRDPDLHKDIVTLGFVKDLRIDGEHVAFTIELTTPACPVKDLLRDQARAAVSAVQGVRDVDVQMTASVRAVSRPELGRAPVEGVKNVIAVGAGKGGVGKTTVAVNLAVALASRGSRVALLDGDMYGPNVPIMVWLKTQLETDGKKIIPAERYGLQIISMGFLTQDDTPVIWRGPMLHGAIQQFFRDAAWDNVDYL